MDNNILPATLALFGKTQCTRCGNIISVDKVEQSKRWPDDQYYSHLCSDCIAEVDKWCECSRTCQKCERYLVDCYGCKMPPCKYCEANKHFKEVK